ncbi:MAG: UDP-N-acetylmuramate dehydrogenase, partial [Anaerolineales bacterium]
MTDSVLFSKLRAIFGERLQENVRLANYTTARVGGVADGLLVANSSAELVEIGRSLWELSVPFRILGSGSNVLVSDAGFRGVVVLNHARAVKIDARQIPPTVWAESGASLSGIARQAALRCLSGLEWAATIPGTVGGAVYGNAGAHGADMQTSLLMAEILHPQNGIEMWTCERLGYEYRSSVIKRERLPLIILSVTLRLSPGDRDEIRTRMQEYVAKRRRTQPPGASMGSMFKNPPGDFAGRLIEAAGLKGTRIGGAKISPIHANFFINDGNAT